MKALLLEEKGSLDAFRIAETAIPTPAAGELLIRIGAAGLNPVDYKLAYGGHPAWTYPFILGLDGAGVVEAVGEGVSGWAAGDRAVWHGNLSRPGTFAEYAVTPARVVARIPAGVDDTDAAAIPCAGYTAYLALFARLKIRPGQSVLIQAAAGGVGGYAVQLASHAGCRVIATASAEHAGLVRGLGAHEVIDYRTEPVPERVLELTGGTGVDAIVDPVGADTAAESLKCLRFGGGIACLVRMPDTTNIRPFTKAPSIHEVSLGGAYFHGTIESQSYMAHIGEAMMAMLESGDLRSMVSEVIVMDGIPDALKRLEQRHVSGKIVAKFR